MSDNSDALCAANRICEICFSNLGVTYKGDTWVCKICADIIAREVNAIMTARANHLLKTRKGKAMVGRALDEVIGGLDLYLYIQPGDPRRKQTVGRALGKKIVDISLRPENNGALVIMFDNGDALIIFDGRRLCCERRYLHTDDILPDFVGAVLSEVGIRGTRARQRGHMSGIHEIDFLIVTTSKGAFTIETHNIHNGYYGGFDVICLHYSRSLREVVECVKLSDNEGERWHTF